MNDVRLSSARTVVVRSNRPLLLLAAVVMASTTVATPVAAQQGAARSSRARHRAPASPFVHASHEMEAGEYLTTIGGCNDCHTSGWAESNGKTPSAERFTGSDVGYRGPWGTTYAANLRLVTQRESEDEWVHILTTADGGKGRPPMPWMNTAATSDRDLRAMYRYIKSLGARGERTPRGVGPKDTPKTKVIEFVPVDPQPR